MLHDYYFNKHCQSYVYMSYMCYVVFIILVSKVISGGASAYRLFWFILFILLSGFVLSLWSYWIRFWNRRSLLLNTPIGNYETESLIFLENVIQYLISNSIYTILYNTIQYIIITPRHQISSGPNEKFVKWEMIWTLIGSQRWVISIPSRCIGSRCNKMKKNSISNIPSN